MIIRQAEANTLKRTATATDYDPSVLTDDDIIAVTNTDSTRAIIISIEDVESGSESELRVIIIKDESGNASNNNITISLESGNIDGAGAKYITVNYDSLAIYLDGTNGWTYFNQPSTGGGSTENAIVSEPGIGEYRISDVRLDPDKKVVVKYNETPI